MTTHSIWAEFGIWAICVLMVGGGILALILTRSLERKRKKSWPNVESKPAKPMIHSRKPTMKFPDISPEPDTFANLRLEVKGMQSERIDKATELIRKALETAGSKQVSLENELDLIEKFVQLKAASWDLLYKVDLHEEIDPETLIDPRLVQPTLEKALGTLERTNTTQRILNLRFMPVQEDVLAMVEFNGIDDGDDRREESGEKSSLSPSGGKVGYQPLLDADGSRTGTRIIFSLGSQTSTNG